MHMGIFSGLFRSRDKPKDSYDSPSYSYFFGRTQAGKRVNDRTAMQIIAVYQEGLKLFTAHFLYCSVGVSVDNLLLCLLITPYITIFIRLIEVCKTAQ